MKETGLFLGFLLISILIHANNIIVKVGNKEFTKEEYEQIYIKNNAQLSDESQIKNPVEYMDLFIDYKLKVLEAESFGMDTTQDFKDELKGYRDELAKQYLTDITITESMVEDAYYRAVNEVRASHILINVDPNAAPEDTLRLYNHIIDIRNQFIKGEEKFEDLALRYSEDPSARQNQGDLGYFKAFNMLIEFENAAYNTPVGEVSMPVRTRHGYHIIYVTDKFKSEGEVKVSHIMKIFSSRNEIDPEEDKKLKNEIDSIYNELMNGADWNQMTRIHSDDKSTSRTGGTMSWISKTFPVKEFAEGAFDLENIDDISKPIRSDFGWHILKLNEKRPPKTFEEMKGELTYRVKKDPQRSEHSKATFLNKLKEEYTLIEHDDEIEKFKNHLLALGDTIHDPIASGIMALPLYSINDKTFTVQDFFDLQETKKKNKGKFMVPIILAHLELYKDEVYEFYEDSVLEEKYPDFAQTMQEYRDGMLLFSVMQKEVWDKAVQDTTGLKKYYYKNKGKYLWDDYFEGLVVRAYNDEAFELCKSFIDQGIVNRDTLSARINTDKTNILLKEGKWEKGENERVDYFVFDGPEPSRFVPEHEFVHGETFEAGTPKTLEEARGFYISDYQKVLEEEWMKKLRKKYKVKMNKKLLNQVESLL